MGFLMLGAIISCEDEVENNARVSESVDFTREWEVTAYNDSTFIYGPFKVTTLANNAEGNDSITIKDSEMNFWKFQVKPLADKKVGTFETQLSVCEWCEESIGIKISNGIISESDSIYFEIQFEDDETPYGNTYKIKGYPIGE